MKKALLIVDVQRDFCEGGSLAAHDTLSLLEPLNTFIGNARQCVELVVFTQDWHPTDHTSFRKKGKGWPIHCIAASRGAELMPPLKATPNDLVIRKGTSPNEEGYSAFESTQLSQQLHMLRIESVGICGIATDYCVRATALDAQKAGFDVTVLTDLVRAVDSNASSTVLLELTNAGIDSLDSHAWLDS